MSITSRVKAWSSIHYYKDTVLPRLLEDTVVRISPFANRLSFDVPPAAQRLRCLENYEALRFFSPISSIADALVARMKERGATNGGKYMPVHLRFEEDMVAFSCCVFDGGQREKEDMIAARENGWRGKFTKSGRVILPGANRINGKCLMTPLEVLTACLHSEVFVTTQGGNFPYCLLGHRRYMYGGHSKTIKPDKRRLALLFNNPNIGWKSFKRQILSMRSHSDSKGLEQRMPTNSIYFSPCPDCICHTDKSDTSKSSTT